MVKMRTAIIIGRLAFTRKTVEEAGGDEPFRS